MKKDTRTPAGKLRTAGRGGTIWLSLLLLALVAAMFFQTVSHELVKWDDHRYFLGDPRLRDGPGLENLSAILGQFYFANYHPLTTLSMMMNTRLFGEWAGGHHLMSMLWHGMNSVLLFLVFVRLTGERFRPFLVAPLFAIHPLHVESVA